MPGKGVKRAAWVDCIYEYLDYEFERLLGIGVTLTINLFLDTALEGLESEDSPYDAE